MPDDVIAKLVWSFVARRGDEGDLDDDPQAVIERIRANLAAGRYPGGIPAIAEECGVPWPTLPELLDASAWAGKARWALIQRDRAIRTAVAAGAPKRTAAVAANLTPPAVDRILARTGADNTRW